MSFHLRAQDIRLYENHMLMAVLEAENGDMIESHIDLDMFLGNQDGELRWDSENFSHSAEDVFLAIEGDDRVPVLRASVRTASGELIACDVNLGERIENRDGQLVYLG